MGDERERERERERGGGALPKMDMLNLIYFRSVYTEEDEEGEEEDKKNKEDKKKTGEEGKKEKKKVVAEEKEKEEGRRRRMRRRRSSSRRRRRRANAQTIHTRRSYRTSQSSPYIINHHKHLIYFMQIYNRMTTEVLAFQYPVTEYQGHSN